MQLGAGLLLDGSRFVELIGTEELAAQKDVSEIAARLGHERSLRVESVQDAIRAMRQTTGDDNGSVWHDDCQKGRKKRRDFMASRERKSVGKK